MTKLSLQAFLACVVSAILRKMPLSYIWGTASSFITLYQGSAPLSILYNPVVGSLYILGMYFFNNAQLSLVYLIKGLPSLYAGWYLLSYRLNRPWVSRTARCIIPLFCILAFVFFPHIQAPAYITVIPWIVCIFLYQTKNFFIQCFTAMYAAGALGSITHMYFFNALTTPEYVALFPVTCIERFILACTLCAVHYCITAITPLIQKYFFKNRRLIHSF